MALSDRFFFVTCCLARTRALLATPEFECLADVLKSRRVDFGFLITAWVFLPDHWHAILFPKHPLTISGAMNSVKTASTMRINGMRGESGNLWQGRFFDRVLRTVKEYRETVDYIHCNPVEAGLVKRAEDWSWSSAGHHGRSKHHIQC
ncbi:MAG TPA: transposase [Candidatus Acidoferrales bacterium]|nr:transposase [Candidatus Acidoferrales bacterium]